jgi:hypothetical protein
MEFGPLKDWLILATNVAVDAIDWLALILTLRQDTRRDARRFRKQMANPIQEKFVGVGHPFALMHQLEPRFNRECLEEPPDIGDVFVKARSIGAVAPSRVSQFIDGAMELRAVCGVDGSAGPEVTVRRPAPKQGTG